MRPVVFISTFWRSGFNEELGPLYLVSVLRRGGVPAQAVYRHVGDQSVFEKVAAINPAIVGFAMSHKSTGLEPIRAGGGYLKRANPSIHLTAGGVFIGSNWRNALGAVPSLDSVMVGESEDTIGVLYDAVAGNKRLAPTLGLAFRTPDGVNFAGTRPLQRDLDSIPWPARDYVKEHLHGQVLKAANIVGSRGCRGTCSFCNVPSIYRRPKLRVRKVESIVDEMEAANAQDHVNIFNFTDSSFEDHGKDSLYRFAREVKRRNLNVAYNVCFRAEAFRNTEEDHHLIAELVESGLYQVLVGFEASDDQDLARFKKIATESENELFIKSFACHPVHISKGFMMFTPYSTLGGLRRQLAFMEQMGFAHELIFMTTQAEVYDGTRFVKDLQKDGLLDANYDWESLFPYRFNVPVVGAVAKALRSLRNDPKLLEDMEYTQCFGRGAFVLGRLLKCWDHPVVKNFRSEVSMLQRVLAGANSAFFRSVLDLAEDDFSLEKFRELRDGFLEDQFKPTLQAMKASEAAFSDALLKNMPEARRLAATQLSPEIRVRVA